MTDFLPIVDWHGRANGHKCEISFAFLVNARSKGELALLERSAHAKMDQSSVLGELDRIER
jgi:hypothetical protein